MENTVRPYNKDESKKEQVSRMFNRIAPYYDFLNRFLSLGIDTIWRKKAIRELDPATHKVVLDVATGTGDMILEIYKQFPETESVKGIDISADMLEIGRQKIKKSGLEEKVEMLVGDSENLPLKDNTVDALTVAFGVRNYEHLEKGLAEMLRVMRPGGKVVILEFSKPTVFPLKQLFNLYFKYMLPLIGRLTSKDPKAYQYLYESVQAFPDGAAFIEILSKTGFKSNQCKSLTFGICSIYTGVKPS